jgi:mRNA-degrading endonuclease RelE of RelBE toxin-antitoxin system
VIRKVIFSTAAAKDYQNLDRQIKLRIDEKLAILAAEPLAATYSKVLSGQGGLRSARVGNWRILYLPEVTLLNVTRIRHRREVYNRL